MEPRCASGHRPEEDQGPHYNMGKGQAVRSNIPSRIHSFDTAGPLLLIAGAGRILSPTESSTHIAAGSSGCTSQSGESLPRHRKTWIWIQQATLRTCWTELMHNLCLNGTAWPLFTLSPAVCTQVDNALLANAHLIDDLPICLAAFLSLPYYRDRSVPGTITLKMVAGQSVRTGTGQGSELLPKCKGQRAEIDASPSLLSIAATQALRHAHPSDCSSSGRGCGDVLRIL